MATYKGSAADANRSTYLAKQRESDAHTFEQKRQQIIAENTVHLHSIDDQFAVKHATHEEAFKQATIGLVSAAEFKAKRQIIEDQKREEEELRKKEHADKRKKKDDKRKKKFNALSFNVDDDEEELPTESGRATATDTAHSATTSNTAIADNSNNGNRKPGQKEEKLSEDDKSVVSASNVQAPLKRVKLSKNPDVDTHFLPDREREEEESELKKQLASVWQQQQEEMKAETIEIVYSYWDGSGHRNKITLTKGSTILQLLEQARRTLCDDYYELRHISADQLMYIKEDLIIPHHMSFYDFIVTKARGKSGPLFHFGVFDDVRMVGDSRLEKDESHAGKICTRAWYERNKHVFPSSRWEMYDPNIKWDVYTIKGGTQQQTDKQNKS